MNLRTLLVSTDRSVLNEAFLRSLTAIAKQGKRAFGESRILASVAVDYPGEYTKKFANSCLYRTTDEDGAELRCVVGWLMDDEEQERFEGRSVGVNKVARELVNPEQLNYNFLCALGELQELHDTNTETGDKFRLKLFRTIEASRADYKFYGVDDAHIDRALIAIRDTMEGAVW